MKTKRKPRNKIMKTKPDLSIPISLDIIGTEDDPCFGKLFDPRSKECSRCGDSEICAIVMGQNNHKLRLEQEKKNKFKDLEELEIKPNKDKKAIRTEAKLHIREMIKRAGGKPIDMKIVINEAFALFAKDGYTKPKIKKLIEAMVEKSNHIHLIKNKLKWK